MCHLLNCCQRQMVQSTCCSANLTIHSLNLSFRIWLPLLYVDFYETMYTKFCGIFMLSQAQECGRNPYIEQCLLVQDTEPSDQDKDINLPHLQFGTPAHAKHWFNRHFYKCTIVDCPESSQEYSLVCSHKVPHPTMTVQKHLWESKFHSLSREH